MDTRNVSADTSFSTGEQGKMRILHISCENTKAFGANWCWNIAANGWMWHFARKLLHHITFSKRIELHTYISNGISHLDTDAHALIIILVKTMYIKFIANSLSFQYDLIRILWQTLNSNGKPGHKIGENVVSIVR